MKLAVVGDKDTVLLFAFAGVEGRVVDNANEAIEEIRQLKRTKQYALIIITEQVSIWAEELILSLKFSKELPLILDIPSSMGHLEEVKSLAKYIKETIGIKI